ncbi:hypothetical protein SERLA73DRAFT_72719 [Serpula lacrymans var. lacrymans S7.3]|uniref:Uncharacterized protein n=2 Tax=Serpula lacrymans var. lacrymans TaxID=341189 RepID=F8PWE5_SERL3|nr:uncharacterized protein SERLADRAFT_437249 [Serpula lacrymans var. lacrymans S7.9]EGN99950.1 hypothetical protein SERLA73DRAFT_72719 [Serpula lacrymans var. lacrymans S7.3]EGO25515.1 hypothetical protein SERLADRAFT_437249 [Serpula lacrymans var. lacrymans S7.9]
MSDLEKGLFKGCLLVKAYMFLFTSPTSAESVDLHSNACTSDNPDVDNRRRKRAIQRERTNTRRNVATIIGLKSVTARSIAFTAVQVCFSLSDLGSWREVDGDFNYCEFYNNILSFFEDTPGPRSKQHVTDLLAWWNLQVFKCSSGLTDVRSQTPQSSYIGAQSAQLLAAQRKLAEQGVY